MIPPGDMSACTASSSISTHSQPSHPPCKADTLADGGSLGRHNGVHLRVLLVAGAQHLLMREREGQELLLSRNDKIGLNTSCTEHQKCMAWHCNTANGKSKPKHQ